MSQLFLCADPCSGIMPLARRTGRAASREDKPSLLDYADLCRKNMLQRGILDVQEAGKEVLLLDETEEKQCILN